MFKHGLSVNRKEQTTPEELRLQACRAIAVSRKSPEKVTKTGCEYEIARCENLMNLRFPDGFRMCCVYDTASKADRSHADVVYSGFRLGGKITSGRKKQLVKALATLFQLSPMRDIFPQ